MSKKTHTKPRLLLDLDNTALIYQPDGTYDIHPKLLTDLLPNYTVILYSAREDIADFAERWNVDFIWKGDDVIPEADFLIDDQCDLADGLVRVKKMYKSINVFLRKNNLHFICSSGFPLFIYLVSIVFN